MTQAPTCTKSLGDADGCVLELLQALDTCRPLLEDLREVVFTIDAAGRWSYLSPSWADLLGFDVAASIGTKAWRHVLSEDRKRLRQLLRSMVEQRRQADFRTELRCKAKDGSVRSLDMSVRLLTTARRVVGLAGTLADVTSNRRNEERLSLAASVFDGAHESIVITDTQARIVEVNEAFVSHTGFSREQAIGSTPALLASGRHGKEFYRQMWSSLQATGRWNGEVWNRRADGELTAERVRIRAVYGHDGRPTHYVAIYSDITRLKRHQEELARLTHYDPLTGLPNRMLVLDRLGLLMSQADRLGQGLAVCQLDVDGFKRFNSALGHAGGDLLLAEIARRLTQALRNSDTTARLGGDEFALLLPGAGSVTEVEPLLQRVRAALGRPYALLDPELRVTASSGVALYPNHGRTPEQLVRAADQAMYRAKSLGGSRVCMAGEDTQRPPEQVMLLEEMQIALATGQLRLHYQPKVCAHTGRALGAEALVRWQHPQRGLLLPGAFLPAVLGSPLETQLDLWVILAAVAQLAHWRARGHKLTLSVNVSPSTLVLPDLDNKVAAILHHYEQALGSRLDGIELEVLESAALMDLGAASRAIEACARHGISFALDDFGTGYSSLSYLRRLPVGTLKIDRSFVSGMLSDPGDLHIVRAVIGLAQAFGVTTVAEGVETNEHARALAELGCHQLQGFGIARPMPADALETWLHAQPDRPAWLAQQ